VGQFGVLRAVERREFYAEWTTKSSV